MVREPETSSSRGKRAASRAPERGRRSSLTLGDDHDITQEQFMEMVRERPEWVYGRIIDFIEKNELSEQEKNAMESVKNQTLQGELLKTQERLSSLEQELDEVKTTRDMFANELAQNTVRQSRQANFDGPDNRKQKTTKIPDPPMLTDGKEPRFDDWMLLMTQKLEANSDHFDTRQLRRAYVASRCDGKARKHITPRLRTDASNRYEDSDDMLEHLRTIYDDPNRVTIAKNQFRSLYMKTGDKFHDFLSEFLYLAAEAGVAEEDWKDELYHRLTTELQKLTMVEKIKEGSFNEFSSSCSQTANYLEIINHRHQRNRAFTPSSNRGSTAKGTTLTDSPVKKEEDTDYRNQLLKQGKCFTCFQHGHLSRDCPKKKMVDTEIKKLEGMVDDNLAVSMGGRSDGPGDSKNA